MSAAHHLSAVHTLSAIRVPEIPRITHRSSFYRPGFLSMTIIGKSGCGKTRLLASILPDLSPSIKTVIIATIMRAVPQHIAIRKYFRDHGVYCEIVNDPEEMAILVDGAERLGYVTMRRQGLIIFDDFNDGRATGPYWDFTVHAFTKLRNTGWNFIILAQQPQFIPTIVRNNTTARILFDCYGRPALDSFARDLQGRIPEGEGTDAYERLVDYIRSVPYSYIMVREHPFEISAGKLGSIKTVITESSVIMPTLRELESEMGVRNKRELDEASAEAQVRAGNTARELGKKINMN